MCAISKNILNRCFIFIHIIRDGVNFWFYFLEEGGGRGFQFLIEIRVINHLGNYVDDANCVRNLKAIVYKIVKFCHFLIPCVKIGVCEVRCVVRLLLFKS